MNARQYDGIRPYPTVRIDNDRRGDDRTACLDRVKVGVVNCHEVTDFYTGSDCYLFIRMDPGSLVDEHPVPDFEAAAPTYRD